MTLLSSIGILSFQFFPLKVVSFGDCFILLYTLVCFFFLTCRLCIIFLGFDVFFVVFCVALACVVGLAVCCCLPCIIAILYAVADEVSSLLLPFP